MYSSVDAIKETKERWIHSKIFARDQIVFIQVVDPGPGIPPIIYVDDEEEFTVAFAEYFASPNA